VLVLLLGRTMTKEDFGAFLYSWSWLELLAVVAVLGFDPLLIREVPVYGARRQWARLAGLLRRGDQITVSLGALITVAGLAIVGAKADSLDPVLWPCLPLALCGLPIRVIAILRQATLVALERPAWGLCQLPLLQPAIVLTLVLAAMAAGVSRPDATMVVAFGVSGMVVTSISGHLLVRRFVDPEVPRSRPEFHTRQWLTSAWPMLMMAGAALVLTRVDIVMVGALMGTEPAAEYGVASRAADLVRFGMLSATPVLAPSFARLWALGDRSGLQQAARLAARIGLAIAAPIVLALALVGPFILELVGPGYVSAYQPMMMLAGGYLVATLGGASTRLLLAAGRERLVAVIVCSMAGLDAVANFVLIPPLGIEGAAIATVIASVTGMLWSWAATRRLVHVAPTAFGRSDLARARRGR
jgi:O-antigen/teichoic acid export membrane protein